MFIYVIVCSETLKIYIGQHKGNSLQKYLQTKLSDAKHRRGGRSHLFGAMRMHPSDAWSIHPLVQGVETRQALDEMEKHFIRALNTQNSEVGYNICRGGEGFTGPASDETKNKHSVAMKAYYAAGGPSAAAHRQQSSERGKKFKHTAEAVERIRAANTGKKHSVQALQKMSAAHKGQQVGADNPFFGRQHSEETKRKNADAHRKPASAETKAKMAASQRARQAKIRLFVP
jgi:group I intron endonuclease